jgi:acetylornithine deacetylase/succinyl-diaminopimelate desuccinylase-like protein
MFQPGEEGLHGARVMIEEGLLGDPLPDAAFALHVWPTLPHGAVACRAGAILASTDMLHARIVGEGGHAAMPHDARDPVPVAAEIILALQSEVARKTPVTDPIVLSITKINAGTTHNVLPEAVDMLGTLRTLSPEARARGREAFERICTHVSAAHGCTAEVKIEQGYDRIKAAAFAWESTAFPMLTGTLVTAAGFLPIATAASSTGEYTRSIFQVVTIALLISWVAAVVFIPYLGYQLLTEQGEEAAPKGRVARVFRRFRDAFAVHGGGDDRQLQPKVAREPRAEVDILGQNKGMRGDEGNVVVGESFSLDA